MGKTRFIVGKQNDEQRRVSTVAGYVFVLMFRGFSGT